MLVKFRNSPPEMFNGCSEIFPQAYWKTPSVKLCRYAYGVYFTNLLTIFTYLHNIKILSVVFLPNIILPLPTHTSNSLFTNHLSGTYAKFSKKLTFLTHTLLLLLIHKRPYAYHGLRNMHIKRARCKKC